MDSDPLLSRLVLKGLRLYKVLLSPLFAGSCRYLPSCSDYMAEAVRRHGAAAGFYVGLKRLARCHPWGGSGFDPVPDGHPWKRGPKTGDRGPASGLGTRDSGLEHSPGQRQGFEEHRGVTRWLKAESATRERPSSATECSQAKPEPRIPNPGMRSLS